MRVALVYHAMRLDAGIPKMHVQLARYLVGRGHDVHVYGNLADSDPALVEEVRFHDVGVPSAEGRLGKAWSTEEFMRRVRVLLRADRPDVVHARGTRSWVQDIAHVTGLYDLERARAAHEVEHPPARRPRWRLPLTHPLGVLRVLHERQLAGDDRVLFHAETRTIASGLTSLYGIDASRVTTVLPGVDVHTFAPDGPRADLGLEPPVVVFCGHDYERKGLDRLLYALPRMHVAASLAVVGGGRHAASGWDERSARPFERLAGELGIAGRVRFLGARADVAPVFRAADVLAHPARFDVWALAVAEGMASGLPAVVSRTTGAAELVDGTNGQVIDGAAGPDELAAALDAQLAPERRAEAGRAARETALRISVERQGALVEHDLERVLEAKRGAC